MKDELRITGDALDGFFYDLLRDHLPAGTLEKLVRDAEAHAGKQFDFTNKHIAAYAKEVRVRLEKAVEEG